jgi:hypothetical protein
MMRLLISLIYFGLLAIVLRADVTFTQQKTPIITTIKPNFGSVEGGTKITISGANFQSDFLFTECVVYIGNSKCDIVPHYTDDSQIVCFTPKCQTESCLSNNLYSGTSVVAVKVYVSSVEGILEATSTFTYNNYWSPSVFWLQSATWGTATSSVIAYTRNSKLSDIDIKIGDNYAYLGAESNDAVTLNSDTLSFYQQEKTIFYRPPEDMPGGFYNFSFTIQNDQSSGTVGTGKARMFENGKLNLNNFKRWGLFDSTLNGTVHSIVTYPTITSIKPSYGSIAGGTNVVIKGTGFSYSSSEFIVYVGGVPCDITDSHFTSILCTTRPRKTHSDTVGTGLGESTMSISEVFGEHINPDRARGSPGWWVKMWNIDDYYRGVDGDSNTVKLSFPWHQKFLLSMYDAFGGYSWTDIFNFNTNHQYFLQESGAVFTAPYAGYYTFFIASDDIGELYASTRGIGVDEFLLAHNPYYVADMGNYYKFSSQISDPIILQKGEVLYLRFRNVSS